MKLDLHYYEGRSYRPCGAHHSRRLRVLHDISDCSQTVTVSHYNTVPDLTEPRVSRAIVEKMVASTQNTGPRMLGQTGV